MAESQGKPTSDHKRTSPSGAEVIFLIFLVAFGMGLSVWGERVYSFVDPAPAEQQFLGQPSIKEKQERLTRLETAIKEGEKQLDALDLENLKHTATLQSYEKSHPELRSPSPGGTTSPTTGLGMTAAASSAGAASSAAEVVKNYQAVKTQQLAAIEYAALLKPRIVSLKTEAQQTALALESDKRIAEGALTRQRWIYMLKKSGAAFGVSLLIVLLAFFIGARFFNRVSKRKVWISGGGRPVLLVLGALLILLAYQAFEVAGAVFIGMILFLFLLRKIDWSPKSGAR